MFRRLESIYIEAPREAVFDYISDVTKHPEWAHEKIEVAPAAAPQAGGKYDFVVHFMGKIPGEVEVLESSPPRRFVYRSNSKASEYVWTFELEPEGSGTRLTHSFERVREMLVFRAMQPVMYPIMGRRMVVGGLRNIKARVEAATKATAAA